MTFARSLTQTCVGMIMLVICGMEIGPPAEHFLPRWPWFWGIFGALLVLGNLAVATHDGRKNQAQSPDSRSP